MDCLVLLWIWSFLYPNIQLLKMKSVFMVAEKPSLAASLATILSNGKCSSHKGMNGSCSVHEWTGTFQNNSAKLKMTSVCGHVMSLDFISKYNNWDRVDPVELFSCATEKKEAMAKLRMPQFLAQEARGFDTLVLWLDCDKEGENICYEVMDCVSRSMNGNVYSHDVTYRAKFSAITDKDIKAAFANLGRPNENEARSVDARQELDLRIGCAFTRFQTRFFQDKYGDLDASLISYGPCQTPTLGFCVQRHDQIQTFKPEPYWCVAVSVEPSGAGVPTTLQWSRVRCFDRDVAAMFAGVVRDCTHLQVVSVTRKEKTKGRPVALNSVELMRVASASLGMGPHHAMQIAEKLYIQGYISYPRTETTAYPEGFDLTAVLRQQTGCTDWGKEASQILRDGVTRPRSGKDVGDHPPITPTRGADRSDLDGDSWRIYDYIVRHFIASIARDCKYVTTTATLTGGGESFTIAGNNVTDPGWTALMPWHAVGKGSGEQGVMAPPIFTQEERLKLLDCKLTEHQTQPPDYLTEAELITLMEKHGIGTDASIPVHINNICQRNYVNVSSSGRKLIPTSLGIVLVHGYQKIDPQLVLPTMRSAVEEQLNLIALGKANFTAVLRHTVEIFRLKFQYFVQNIEGMDQLFEVSFSSLSDSGKSFSRCGKCRRYMKYIQAKPVRLHCPQCDETYNVPQTGNIRLFRELKCPLDDFELLSWSMGAKGRSYPFCPYCYNNTPFPDMKKGTGCNGCSHPTCPYSLNMNGVSSCVECEVGVLVLDPSSGPKWKLGCNKCDVIVQLFEDAQRVSVLDTSCDDCGAPLLSVRYGADKNRLPAGAGTDASGCIFCSEILTPLVEKRKAKQFCTTGGGRGRGGGRSRGGRGRGGRGGGTRVPKDKMAQLAAYFV